MIYGIGTDICDVRRIRTSLGRHGDRFAERVLGEDELAVWRARSARPPPAPPSGGMCGNTLIFLVPEQYFSRFILAVK